MKAIILIFCIYIIPMALFSQEVQVPLDKDNKIMVIDQEMESKLGLFGDNSGFVDAKLFKINNDLFILEITYKVDSKIHRKRKELTKAEVDELRQKVSDNIIKGNPKVQLDQEGRTEFLVKTTLLSLGLYAPTVTTVLNLEEESAVSGYLITSAAGFFLPYYLTEDESVTKAQSELAIYGGIAGASHFAFLDLIINNDDVIDDDEILDSEWRLALTSLFSIGELIAGYHIAKNLNMSEGTAEVITSTGTLGTLYGLATYGMFDSYEGDDFITYGEDSPGYGTLGLLGSLAGMGTGYYLSTKQDFSKGDAAVYTFAGYLGAWIPFSVFASFADDLDSPAPVYGSMILGSMAGLYVGNHLIKGKNFSKADGTIISWGSFISGLLGAGIGVLIDESEPTTTMLLSTAFSTGAFAFFYNQYKDDAINSAFLPEGLKVNVSPIGITQLLNNKAQKNDNMYYPVLNVHYTFK